jgi:alpha-tubulin suppressor-like RCC1 family protein
VAGVNGSGVNVTVTPVSAGTATITVTTADGGHTANCVVTVSTPATGVELDKNTMALVEGGGDVLVATVAPPTASNTGVSWQTSNPGVAAIAPNGQTCQVTGAGAGAATITATTLDGGHAAACAVTVERGEPLPIRGATIAAAYPSGSFCLAIKGDGTLWGWGEDGNGQLGQGTTYADGRTYPVQIGTASNWAAVAAGRQHSLAINANGELWAWGRNNYGQVGRGGSDTSNQLVPIRVGTASDWVAVSAGAGHSLGLRLDGSLWSWGRNNNGQLGNRDTSSADRFEPVRVGGSAPINDVAAVEAGSMFSFAIKADGTLWGWGLNSGGQLALGSGPNATQTQYGPVQEAGQSTNWAAVSGGGGNTDAGGHALAIRNDGSLWVWGRADEGKLGDDGAAPTFIEGVVTTPFRLGTATDWTAVSAGYSHSMAVKNGDVWGWGGNMYGGVGTGGTEQQNVPVLVGAGGDWVAVAAGNNMTIALKANGELWAWGWNNFGQLGLGYFSYTEPELLPVKVGGGFMVPAN